MNDSDFSVPILPPPLGYSHSIEALNANDQNSFFRLDPRLFTRRGGFDPAPEIYDALNDLNDIIQKSLEVEDIQGYFNEQKRLIQNIIFFIDCFIDNTPMTKLIGNFSDQNIHTEWIKIVKTIFY